MKKIIAFLAGVSQFFFLPCYGEAVSCDWTKELCAENIYSDYFDLQGGVSQACRGSLNNALHSIPPELRKFLSERISKKRKKYAFVKVSFQEAKKQQYSGTVHGVPSLYAVPDTIYTSTDICARINEVMVHEIGHLIHFAIMENHPSQANKWSRLWSDVYRRAGSPKDPVAYIGKHCGARRPCPFLGWKDADNEMEGFARLVEVRVKEHARNTTHPDYVRKTRFMDELIKYARRKFQGPTK